MIGKENGCMSLVNVGILHLSTDWEAGSDPASPRKHEAAANTMQLHGENK